MGFPIRAHFTIENLTVFQRKYERGHPFTPTAKARAEKPLWRFIIFQSRTSAGRKGDQPLHVLHIVQAKN